MRFDVIPDTTTRIYDGPFYGVRVLSAASSATCVVDSMPLPTQVLPGYSAPKGRAFRQIVASGPIVIAIADAEDEDVASLQSSPAGAAAGMSLLARWTGFDAYVPSPQLGAGTPVVIPPGTRALLTMSQSHGSGTNGLELALRYAWGSPSKTLSFSYAVGWYGTADGGRYLTLWSPFALGQSTPSGWLGDSLSSNLKQFVAPVVAGPAVLVPYTTADGNTYDLDVYAVA